MEIPWALFRKAALVLFGIALLAGLGSTALFMGQRLSFETWRIVFILALIVLTVTSAVLLPGVLLPDRKSPHPEFLSDDLADEWRDLRERRIDRPHVLLLGAALAGLVYLWNLFYYGKVTNALWFGWLPVGVVAILLGLLLFAFARRTDWYNNRAYRTPGGVIFIAFAGFIAAQVLGIVMTEQIVEPSPAQSLNAPKIDYAYAGTRAYRLTRGYLQFGPVPDIEIPDCDGDACGYLFLFIIFLVLTLILVVGAALIPHMWVLSCLVLLTFIALLVLHEVRRDRTVRAGWLRPEMQGEESRCRGVGKNTRWPRERACRSDTG